MIFRRRLQNKFTAISNAICVDTGMSTDARWCLWYLLTKPEDWIVRPKDIQAVSGWGKDKAYRVIGELVSAKYFVVSQTRDEGGQFGPISYDVYDEPHADLPFPENPDAVSPVTENKEHTKDLQVPSTEEIQNTDSNILVDADFEAFWAAYPKRNGPNPKTKAREKYKQMRKAKVSHETLMDGVNRLAKSRENEDPTFTPQAATWINQRRWEDDCGVRDAGSTADASTVSDEDLDAVINQYKGIASDRMAAKRILAAEISGGASLDRIVEAAEKYAMHRKQMRYDGIEITAPILETWLKFKWREMDAYFISKSPMRKPILKPVSEKRK